MISNNITLQGRVPRSRKYKQNDTQAEMKQQVERRIIHFLFFMKIALSML